MRLLRRRLTDTHPRRPNKDGFRRTSRSSTRVPRRVIARQSAWKAKAEPQPSANPAQGTPGLVGQPAPGPEPGAQQPQQPGQGQQQQQQQVPPGQTPDQQHPNGQEGQSQQPGQGTLPLGAVSAVMAKLAIRRSALSAALRWPSLSHRSLSQIAANPIRGHRDRWRFACFLRASIHLFWDEWGIDRTS
jgi:hypothetical protein